MPFRLPPGQMRDFEAVANAVGKTRQRYLADLVLHEISQYKEIQKIKKQPIGSSPTAHPTETHGLGIAAALQKTREHKEQQVTEQVAPTAPVVVQIGNTGAPTANGSMPLGELDRLALYIIKGDDFLRDARKRTAVEILRASATTDEEFNVLVARLEENVAIKTKTTEENSGVNKLARFAFDKLSSLLRGD
jgi:hypothetical protein